MELDPVWATRSPVAFRASFPRAGALLGLPGPGVEGHCRGGWRSCRFCLPLPLLICGCKINAEGVRSSGEL